MALKGEVYKVSLTETREQVVEVEIENDGEDPTEVAWEAVEMFAWDTIHEDAEVIEQVTCGGEV